MNYKEFIEFIQTRRTIRKYKQRETPQNILEKIFEAARWAPSWLNQQPWEFILIKNIEKKKAVGKIYDDAREELGLYRQDTLFLEAAALVLALADMEKKAPVIGTSLAMQNMILAAHSLGLGANIMGTPVSTENSRNEMRKLFNVPKKYELIALMAFGYADEEPEPKPKRTAKEFVHVNVF